jgi:hypothetical protein
VTSDTPLKVENGELDAERRNAAHRAFWVSRKGNPIKVSIDAAIHAYLALASPVDHPEVGGVASLCITVEKVIHETSDKYAARELRQALNEYKGEK